ncbi:MAG TPA: PEP-CTERM sorting domain-containing protein [Phycisphaerae bacterium]|nr:PEP-CTERM sorting domain-containing protein [Phycisphaerae bacterium]HRY67074.1 PEP-CTERM sorting domain-containing protein [Phycisphaerae bacterium]HSA29820.1 PEP-CTERM sorting domain-containing protein [Phycisphaerae bacterium]
MSIAKSPSFQGVGDLSGGFFWSDANAVSADGTTVVGLSMSDQGWQAFRWRDGVMIGLGDLPGSTFHSEAYGVSADGSVVVGVGQSPDGHRAFRWEGGALQSLGNLSAVGESSASGVSADGKVVVGQAFSRFGPEAFRWQDGVMSGLGDLPGGVFESSATGVSGDGRAVTGWSRAGQYPEAFRWVDGTTTRLGSLAGLDKYSQASAISADGSTVVGVSSSTSPSGNMAFRWRDGVMEPLGCVPFGLNSSYACAVSADGSVIVGKSNVAVGEEATIWDESRGLRTLRSVLVDDLGFNLTGWALGRATGVSADGLTIVGQGANPQGQIEGWIAHLPEPTTTILFALGSLLVNRRGRRTAESTAGVSDSMAEARFRRSLERWRTRVGQATLPPYGAGP